MAAPCPGQPTCKPLALILEYAETIVPAVDLGSMGEPDRAALVTLLRWARQADLAEQGHVVVLTTGNLADLNPNLLLSRHGAQIIAVPPPDREARLHFIAHLLSQAHYHLDLTSQELANLGAGLSLTGVAHPAAPELRPAPHHGDGAPQEKGPAAPGTGGSGGGHRAPLRPGRDRRAGRRSRSILPK